MCVSRMCQRRLPFVDFWHFDFVKVNRCFLRRHSRLGVTVVEFNIVAPLFFEVARSGFSVADDDCTDSRKRTLASR